MCFSAFTQLHNGTHLGLITLILTVMGLLKVMESIVVCHQSKINHLLLFLSSLFVMVAYLDRNETITGDSVAIDLF